MADLFDRFSSPFNVNAGSEPEATAPAPASVPTPEPEPAVEPMVVEAASTEDRRPAVRKPRSAGKSKAVAASLSKSIVQRVFAIERRLDDASLEAKRIAADLLKVKQADDAVSMIVALDDAEAVASARQVVGDAIPRTTALRV